MRLPLDGPLMMAEVARTGAPILVSTWKERLLRYPHHRRVHARGGDRAVAGLPLRVEGRTIGALSLAFPTDRDFDTGDRRFMATVADLCAQALERARLYEAVRRSEAQFRQLADAIPQIAWIIDRDGVTLDYLNERWYEYTGQQPAISETAQTNALIHPADRPQYDERWAESLRTGAPFSCEVRLRKGDGAYRWFLSRSVALRNADGRIAKWFGTATDIDDTRRAAGAQRFLAELGRTLATSLDYQETLQRVVHLAVPALADYCFVDVVQADGQIRRVAWAHVDPAEEQLFDRVLAQYVPSRLQADHPISRTLETGEAQFVPQVSETWLAGIAFSAEHLEFMRARNFQSQVTVPLRARGRTLGAITFCFTTRSGRRYGEEQLRFAQDVAERVALAVDNARLYSDARDAETKVRRLLDAGVVGVTVVDREHILEANDYFLAMVGYTPEEVASRRLRWTELTPPEFAAADAQSFVELAERGVSTPFEKEYIRRDGSRVPVLIGGAELQRDPPQWVCFILNLTERKRAEDEWRAFIDATAHDLRNPLTTVLGQTQLMQRRLRRDGGMSPADGDARLTAIAAAATRAAGLIDDLIDTARMRAGQSLEMDAAPIDLIPLVGSCAQEARRVGASHVVRVETDVAHLMVVADVPRIERVIRNVLDNAIKYSPDGGEVVVRLTREEDDDDSWAVVAIRDSGIGIPAADLPYVFDRFHRGSNVAGRIHGSGIGLTGAQQIVTQHGGTIEVASSEGAGSTFTLRLPLHDPGA